MEELEESEFKKGKGARKASKTSVLRAKGEFVSGDRGGHQPQVIARSSQAVQSGGQSSGLVTLEKA